MFTLTFKIFQEFEEQNLNELKQKKDIGSNSVSTGLKILLIFHGIATVAAGVVLIIAPGLIPATVNITLHPTSFLICYLLASTELAIGFISFAALYLTDWKSLRIICITFIVLHLSTACLELYALSDGISPEIWSNIVLRIVMIMLFFYFGVYKNSGKSRFQNL